jgi:transcriptional regulator with XRE-family HTH domain
LKRARKRAGLSLAELAERSGLHSVSIARAERTGQDVKVSTVTAIARALGVPVCELIDEGERHERHERRRRRT